MRVYIYITRRVSYPRFYSLPEKRKTGIKVFTRNRYISRIYTNRTQVRNFYLLPTFSSLYSLGKKDAKPIKNRVQTLFVYLSNGPLRSFSLSLSLFFNFLISFATRQEACWNKITSRLIEFPEEEEEVTPPKFDPRFFFPPPPRSVINFTLFLSCCRLKNWKCHADWCLRE